MRAATVRAHDGASTPLTDPRLTGLLDFPALQVAPGSRRGVIPDADAAAFAAALRGIEPDLALVLERFEQRRVEALDRAVIRDLQRVFRDFYRQRPRYTMLPVEKKEDLASGPPSHSGASGPGMPGAAVEAQTPAPSAEPPDGPHPPHDESEPPALFPPGPLTEVRIVPSPVRLECGARHQVRARALDASGRRVPEEVRYRWTLEGAVGRLEATGAAPDAQPDPGSARIEGPAIVVIGADSPAVGTLVVEASSGARRARAESPVEVVEELRAAGRGSDEGIPEPDQALWIPPERDPTAQSTARVPSLE